MFFRLTVKAARNRTMRGCALFAVFFLCSVIHMSCSYRQADVNSVDWCAKSSAECALRFPPEVVAKARESMTGPLIEAWKWKNEWLSKGVFTFVNDHDEQGVFLRSNGRYAHVNCPEGMPFLNEILAEYTFTKADVLDDGRVHSFLDLLRKLYSRNLGVVGSQEFLRIQEKSGNLSRWLEAREQNEAVVRRLFREPAFEVKGDLWTVSYNVFNVDGSVDKWTVAGKFNTLTEDSEVQEVNVSPLKKSGTFSFPFSEWAKEVPNSYWEPIIGKQPSRLLAKAREALEGRLAQVWEWDFHKDWLSNRIFDFSDEYGLEAIFLEIDGDYLQLNCPSGIAPINRIFREYTFEKRGFADPGEVDAFLDLLVGYYGGTGLLVGSSIFLETHANEEDRAYWLQGTEKAKAVFMHLCKDPQFVFQGNKWVVTFNVFKPNGGVDRWEVSGQYDAKGRCNRLETIEISSLKAEGTFSYPLMG